MLRPKILPAIFLVVPAAVLLTAQASLSEPAAEECRASPGSNTPRGTHWYYRINRADKRHCWYLGSMDVHTNARGATSRTETLAVPPQQTSAPEPDRAAPQITPTAPAMMVTTQMTPTPVVFLERSLPGQASQMNFVTRWPDDLPNAQDLDQAEPVAASNSYADEHTATDATAQMPSTWPVDAAGRARQASAGDVALEYVFLAGAPAIVLLLLAGWAAKFTRAPHRSHSRNRWRPIGSRLRWRWRTDFAETADTGPAAEVPHSDPTWRAPTPTDPADDLKTSLAELMRDLRRAGAGAASDSRSFAGPAARTAKGAYRPTLLAAS